MDRYAIPFYIHIYIYICIYSRYRPNIGPLLILIVAYLPGPLPCAPVRGSAPRGPLRGRPAEVAAEHRRSRSSELSFLQQEHSIVEYSIVEYSIV